MATFKPPKSLVFDQYLAQNYEKFIYSFEIFMKASGYDSKDEETKIAIFLNIAGEEAQEVFQTLKFDATGDEKKYTKVQEKFKNHCSPSQNETLDRFKFNTRNQEEGEEFDQFLTAIKKLAKQCNFETLHDSLLRDRIVAGILDAEVQERLFRTRNLTLADAEDICRAAEASKKQVRDIRGTTGQVDALKSKRNNIVEYESKNMCYRCHTKHDWKNCLAFGKTCSVCSKQNHFAVACRRKKQIQGKKPEAYRYGKASRKVHEVEQLKSDSEEDKNQTDMPSDMPYLDSIVLDVDIRKNNKEMWTQDVIIQKQSEQMMVYDRGGEGVGGDGPRGGNRSKVNDDGWSSVGSRGNNRQQQHFLVQTDKMRLKMPQADEPLGRSSLFGSWGMGAGGTRNTQPNSSVNICSALEHADMDRRPTMSEGNVEEEQNTDDLYKKVRAVLNKLTPQKFDSLVIQVRQLRIDTKEKLQGVVNLVFEKATDEPNFSVACALMCKEIQNMQVPVGDEKKSIAFRTLLVGRCQQDFEKNPADESGRNVKLKEIDECTDPEKKEELLFELEEHDRKLRMKSVGTIRFIGELFKQQMLTASIIRRCLQTLLDIKDEESLKGLCELLTTVGNALESKNVDLSSIFDEMKRITDGKRHKISNRLRFMLLDVIDLRDSKWKPRRTDRE